MSTRHIYEKRYTREEAHYLQMLRHPCIVSVLSCDDRHIRMPRYPNDLHSRLQIGELSEARKIIIALGVAYALRHCHRMGIIHCDVKPSNILLTTRSEPVLCDFNLSVTEGDAIPTGGTPMFEAPELLVESLAYRRNNKVDVFAYGCTIRCLDRYDLCYRRGNRLYCPCNERDIANAVRNGARLIVGKGTSTFFRQLIADCTRTLPHKRPSFDSICARIEQYARNEKYMCAMEYIAKYSQCV